MKTILKLVLISIYMVGIVGYSQTKTIKKNDVILLKNQQEIQCQVIEILTETIKYKKAENLDGPIYSIEKNQVFTIIYKNGERESFEALETKATNSIDIIENKTIGNSKIENTAYVPTIVYTLGVFAKQPANFTIPYFYFNCDGPFFKNTDFGIRTFVSGFSSSNSSSSGGIKVNSDIFTISFGVGGNYYFNKLLKLDKEKMIVYGGVSAAYASTDVSISSNSSFVPSSSTSASEVNFLFQVGYVVYYGKHFGLNLELDFKDDAAFKVGVCYKSKPKIKVK